MWIASVTAVLALSIWFLALALATTLNRHVRTAGLNL